MARCDVESRDPSMLGAVGNKASGYGTVAMNNGLWLGICEPLKRPLNNQISWAELVSLGHFTTET